MSSSSFCKNIKPFVRFQGFLGLSVVYIGDETFKVSHVMKNVAVFLRIIIYGIVLHIKRDIMLHVMQSTSSLYMCIMIAVLATHVATMFINIMFFYKEKELCHFLNKLVKIDENMQEQGIKTNFSKNNASFVWNFVSRLLFLICFQLCTKFNSYFHRVVICYHLLTILHFGLQFYILFYLKKCMFNSINQSCEKFIVGKKMFVVHNILKLRQIHQELCHVSRNLEAHFGLKTITLLSNTFNFLFFILLLFVKWLYWMVFGIFNSYIFNP